MDKAIENQTYETNHRSTCHGIPRFVPTNIWPTSLATSAARVAAKGHTSGGPGLPGLDTGSGIDTIRPELSRRHAKGAGGVNLEGIGKTVERHHTRRTREYALARAQNECSHSGSIV